MSTAYTPQASKSLTITREQLDRETNLYNIPRCQAVYKTTTGNLIPCSRRTGHPSQSLPNEHRGERKQWTGGEPMSETNQPQQPNQPISSDLQAWMKNKDSETDNLEANLQGLADAIGKLSGIIDEAKKVLGSRLAVLEGSSSALEHRVGQLQIAESALSARVGALEAWKETHESEEDEEPGEEPEEPTDPQEPQGPIPSKPPAIPSDAYTVPLVVRESASVSRSRAFVSTGVPIPESLNLLDISSLTLLDSKGFPVACDFRPTAYWRTKKSPKVIQWAQLSFFDKFEAGEEKKYKLVIITSGIPWLLTGITVEHRVKAEYGSDKKLVHIDTGAIACTIGSAGLVELFDIKNSKLILQPVQPKIKFDGVFSEWSSLWKMRRLEIEYAGPLVAYVYVETETNLSFGEPLSTRTSRVPGSIVICRRYEFRAGSGTVICQQTIKWEGTKNGSNWLDKDNVKVNGVLGELWQDTYALSNKPTDISAIASRDSDLEYSDIEGATVSISQSLRSNRLMPRRVDLKTDQTIRFAKKSDGGLISLTYRDRGLMFGLYHMDKYEPQSISYNPSFHSISVSYASDKFWLAYRQGVQVKSVIALEDESKLDEVWAELNHPLRVFAEDSSYYSVSAHGPVPSNKSLKTPLDQVLVGSPEDRAIDYYAALGSICDATLSNIDHFGTYGLMTYAGWPRYWGNRDGGDEVGKAQDSTSWDSLYRYGAFTDYYSTSRSSIALSLLARDPTYLDTLSFPSAWRVLHTQIMNGAPDDNWSYIGWAPTGYSAYRSDFNSSHSYFENLYWYYFLTGDRQVIDILSRGQDKMIGTLSNPSHQLSGRFPSQHLGCMRFLGHAHYDAAKGERFSKAFNDLMSRAISENYVTGTYNGQTLHFWADGRVGPDNKIIGKPGAGRNVTLNQYSQGYWDMENLYWAGVYNDKPKSDSLHPWNVLESLAYTSQQLSFSLAGGDGKVSGKMARNFAFTWDGIQGGKITNVTGPLTPLPSPDEAYLYNTDKPGMCAWWARAAQISGDPEMKKRSRELIDYALELIIEGKPSLPMGKIMGLCEGRLMQAVAEEMKG